jgi:archaellum component FlaC
MTVKEHVLRELQSEMEPLRKKVAVWEQQVQDLGQQFETFTHTAQQSQLAQLSLHESVEKKMEMEISPQMEAWKQNHDKRLLRVEDILHNVVGQQDKYSQRQDGIMQCVSDMDERFEKLENIVSGLEKLEKIVSSKAPSRKGSWDESPMRWNEAANHYSCDLDEELDQFSLSRALSDSAPRSQQMRPGTYNLPIQMNIGFHVPRSREASREATEFSFEVDVKGGPLGLLLRNDGLVLHIDQVNDGCLLPVSAGDRIVAVNGIARNCQAMLDEIHKKGKLRMTCQHGNMTTL